MTTEEDFQALLDANPDDHHTRGVFGDWLCDRDDPRGPGYQAMGRIRKHPVRIVDPSDPTEANWVLGDGAHPELIDQSREHPDWPYHNALLPRVWWHALPLTRGTRRDHVTCRVGCWAYFMTRREADDTVARAFTEGVA